MKTSEMNEHQLAAYRLMVEIYNDHIGGYENQLDDSEIGSEEYEEAKRALADGEALAEWVYADTQREATRRGFAKHIRFAGEAFLKERIKRRLIKDGYLK